MPISNRSDINYSIIFILDIIAFVDNNNSSSIGKKYLVALDVYEGPLDLLLSLIENAELDITKVSLGLITNQYLSYITVIKNRDPGEVSSFLVIAAKLIQIKSNALLPKSDDSDMPSDEEDPGEALVQQLILYKKFKTISNILSEKDKKGYHSYLRLCPPPYEVEAKLDLSNITLDKLLQAAQMALQFTNDISDLDEVVSLPRITIREKIFGILDTLRIKKNTRFSALLSKNTRVEVVVTFLAMLELVKQHIVQASQEVIFGEIELQTSGELENIQVDDLEF